MWTLRFTVFTIFPILTKANDNFVNNNDWIPVSTDTIYNQIRHESITVPHYIDSSNIQVINTDINKVLSLPNKVKLEEGISDVAASDIGKFELDCVLKETNNCQNEEIKNISPNMEFDFTPNYFFYTPIENDTGKDTVRQSKKITDLSNKKVTQQLFASTDKPHVKSKEKAYEVTEDDLENLFEPEESETQDRGYKYEPPKKQNMSKGLFEILSKYKINKDDELPNYAVSRRLKAQSPLKQNLPVKPYNNDIPYRYNNLNHLPIDPLLAVFLSNYGYYLQGMYGIRNQYNNLYGYLASNNMHNNRPFGFYKIFSDTDSSH